MSEPIPRQLGSVEFRILGRWVTIRCPPEFGSLMRSVGGKWDPDRQYWLIHIRRIDPVIRVVRQVQSEPINNRSRRGLPRTAANASSPFA